MNYDVIIVGGGAAGLFCAAQAGLRGRKTLLIEHNAQLGRKILISGGGRCNFTNTDVRAENFISGNPHFAKSALAGYTPQDFVELVKNHRISYYEKTLGQLFCSTSSRHIVEMLLAECVRGTVRILADTSVRTVQHDARFRLQTSRGSFSAESLVVATGGLSFAKIGASDFGYRIADQFGIARTELRPSLVALVAAGKKNFAKLAGISCDAIAKTGETSFRENLLFTHRGLSGPAILQISNYWRKENPISLNFLPDIDLPELLANASVTENRQQTGNFLARVLPKKLVADMLSPEIYEKPLSQLNKTEISATAAIFQHHQMRFKDTEGYDRAEVTLGGISTNELSSQTMESKKVKGLYFIGEVIDVTGWLGGYNFQWAWSSAFAAGQVV